MIKCTIVYNILTTSMDMLMMLTQSSWHKTWTKSYQVSRKLLTWFTWSDPHNLNAMHLMPIGICSTKCLMLGETQRMLSSLVTNFWSTAWILEHNLLIQSKPGKQKIMKKLDMSLDSLVQFLSIMGNRLTWVKTHPKLIQREHTLSRWEQSLQLDSFLVLTLADLTRKCYMTALIRNKKPKVFSITLIMNLRKLFQKVILP